MSDRQFPEDAEWGTDSGSSMAPGVNPDPKGPGGPSQPSATDATPVTPGTYPPPAMPPGWGSQPGPYGAAQVPHGAYASQPGAYPPPYSAYPPPVYPMPQRQPTLPVEPTNYFSFWRTPAFRVWKPILAIIVGLIGFFSLAFLLILPAIAIDVAQGRLTPEQIESGEIPTTANLFLFNNISLALLIPLTMLLAWLIIGQRPKWLTSVAGGMRWRFFWTCFGMFAVVWLAYFGLEWWMGDFTDELAMNDDTWLLIGGILLTTPFQAAGEEYLFRGFGNRALASFFPSRGPWRIIIPGIITSILFMLTHGAGDIWLNVMYVVFGLAMSYLTWRTGGLEAAIAMHVVNNLSAEALMPFTDISDMFERGAGTADATILINLAVIGIAVGLVEWRVRRRPVETKTAPGTVALP